MNWPANGHYFPRNWQPSAEVREVLDTCDIVARHGAEALSTYVISMAGKPSDVLAVQLLLKEAGISFPDAGCAVVRNAG